MLTFSKYFREVKRNCSCAITQNMSKKSKGKIVKIKNSTTDVKKSEEEKGPICYNKSNDIIIYILAKPGAKHNSITDISPEGVGIQINAPPTEGEANSELIKYVASLLGLKKNDVQLDRGFKSRNKTLKIVNNTIKLEEVIQKITGEIS